ncbi:hypothetical protein [Actinoplanes rectilineatus]|uniref:hypothetical protein n=1 Tax=Actinoplanes rectilineatus TaxID=113571 RepID=UPI000698274F|nr:hypothetical protein [Actinoplanes rectilineatus]
MTVALAPAPLAGILYVMRRNHPHAFYRRPGRPEVRLCAVLFFAQGHHLARCGQPLFAEAIVRTAGGVHVDLPGTDEYDTALLTEGHAGSAGDAAERYGRMTVTDLRTVLQSSAPWQRTAVGDPIDLDVLRDWFRRAAETDDPDDDRPNSAECAAADAHWAARQAARQAQS